MVTSVTHPSLAAAAELQRQLRALEGERMLALATGLADNDLYMDDLFTEMATVQEAYVGHAVTEIATLRAELDGRLQG
jgi:hypothetical protein